MNKWFWILVLGCFSFWTKAANFDFNSSALPAASLCNTTWHYDGGSTYTCTGNGRVTIPSGGNVQTNSNITIVAANGFSITNSVIGSAGNRINLTSTYGSVSTTATTQIWGNVQTSSGDVTLTSTTLNGTLTTNSSLNSTGGAITGAVSAQNGITATNTVFGSTLTANSSISLSGGSVSGQVWSTSNSVTTNGTNLNGGARSQSSMSITGGTIQGAFIFQSANPLTMTNVNFISGSISGPSTANIVNSTLGNSSSSLTVTVSTNDINVTGSTVYANMTAPGTAKITDSTYTGNIAVNTGKVELDNSVVTGNVTSAGNDIDIKNGSTLTGDATAGNGKTVNVTDSSQVQGDCQPARYPPTACGSAPPVAQDSYWKFDEILWNDSSNEVFDSSTSLKHGRARNGAVTNTISPSPASCTYGDFQRGSGVSNHPFVEITKNSYFHDSDEFSFAFWLKMSNSGQASGTQTIMAYGGPVSAADSSGRFQLTRLSGDILRFSIKMRDGNVRYVDTTDASIFNDQWKHVAFSYSKNNKRMRLYVNAVLVDDEANDSIGNGNNARTPNDGTGNLSIGALPAGTEGIRGQIDEVRFYDKELTSGEVTTIKNLATACPGVGLVLGWDLNQGLWSGASNEVLDFSGNTLHGRTFNGVTSAFNGTKFSGDPGTCSFSQFNGINQYIETADNSLLDIADALTLSVWVKPTSLPAAGGLMSVVSKDNNYEVHLQPDGKVQWWWNNSSGQARLLVSNAVIQTNVWTHIAVVYSSGNQTMYINGASNKTSTETGNLITNSSPLQLGADQGATGRYFHGALDELRVYRGALPLAQVQALATEVRSCNQCFTEDFTSITNWYASAYGNSIMPSREPNPQRLRLTTADTYQSTSMTIRKKFPAAGNKVSVEFNYYAWKPTSGGGADGIAVTLSDASYTPAPGSFGGSLGYAQRISPSNDPGFNGGWLGIGLDEFGNFSNATEGRQGGPGARAQHVAIRGSWPNYNYLTGTNNALSPTLDIVGTNTPGRGHRYRITVDATTTTPTQRAYVKVERDTTGTGNSYTTIINDYDARGTAAVAAGQQAVPEDFFLSFTGATGASVNNHEIATIQVCTVQPAPEVIITPPSAVHHYELNYVSNGVTCEAEKIEVKACADQSCSTLATAAVSTTISATNGGSFVGGASLNFVGSTEVYLSQTNIGETTLAVAGGSNANVCSTTGCKINFANAGFKFYNATSGIAGLQNQVAGVPGSGYLRAVQTNTDTMACEARVAGPKIVSMSYDCVNPGSCITGQTLQLGATTFNGSEEGTVKDVSLTFNAQGYAPLSINYSDVGQLRLGAGLALGASGNDPAATLLGQSDTFVVRPHRINVTTALSSSSATPANAVNPQTLGSGAGFIAAGESFQLYVSPVNANGVLTPNYGNETEPETVAVEFGQLIHPVGGENGDFDDDGNDFVKVTASGTYQNRFHSTGFSWDEVGTISLVAKVEDDDYLETGLGAAADSDPYTVGRFYPAQFTLASSSLENTCSAFSYMGQPAIKLAYEVQAKNLAGNKTLNYGVDYSDTLAEPVAVFANTSPATDLTSRVDMGTLPEWNDGSYLFNRTDLMFSKLAAADGSYAAVQAELQLTDELDQRVLEGATADECGDDCSVSPVTGALDVRFGRLFINSGIGDETEQLRVTVEAQYWNGSNFVRNTLDNCTTFDPEYWGAVKAAEPLAPSAPANIDLTGVPSVLVDGVSLPNEYWLEPPTVRSKYILQCAGTTIAQCIQQSWLQYDWNGDASVDPDDFEDGPEFVFGLRTGNKRQIFWQERLN